MKANPESNKNSEALQSLVRRQVSLDYNVSFSLKNTKSIDQQYAKGRSLKQ